MIRAALMSAALLAAPAFADDAEDFADLIADFEAHELANSPIRAGREGDLDAAARWPDVSPESALEDEAAEAAFLERLEAINVDALATNDQVSHAVLDYVLRFRVELAPFDMERMSFTNDSASSPRRLIPRPRYARATRRKPRPGLSASTESGITSRPMPNGWKAALRTVFHSRPTFCPA